MATVGIGLLIRVIFNLSILVANYTEDNVSRIHLFPRMQNMGPFNSDFRELKLYAW